MASYPNTVKTFTNPTVANKLNNPPHATQHADANDEIAAIETELGTVPKGSYGTVRARLEDAVYKVDDQTVAGIKTFSSSPVVPLTPTTTTQAASKGYVDTTIASSGVGAPVSKSAGVIYQAATDGFLMGNTYTAAQGNGFEVRTDSASTPTTVVVRSNVIWVSGGQPTRLPIFAVIKKSNYYLVKGYDYQGTISDGQVALLTFTPIGL